MSKGQATDGMSVKEKRTFQDMLVCKILFFSINTFLISEFI